MDAWVNGTWRQTLQTRARRVQWRKLGFWAGMAFGAGLLLFAALFLYREREALLEHLLRADRSQLLGVAAWYTVDLLIYMAGWISILTALGGRVKLREHVRIYCVMNAAKRLPGTLWYVGGRVAQYRELGIPVQTVLIASGIEAVVTWVSAAVMALPFLAIIMPGRLWLWGAIGALLALVALNPPVLRWLLARTVRDLPSGSVGLPTVYAWVLLYAAAWAVGGIFMFFVARIYAPLPFGHLLEVVESWTLAGAVSYLTLFLPTNFGVTEASLAVLLSRMMPAAAAALAAVSVRILLTILDLAFGAVAAALAWLWGHR